MGTTATKIATVDVGVGGASSIDFTSIPSTYTDLWIKLSIRTSKAGSFTGSFAMQFNADTGSNYNARDMYGAVSSTGSASTLNSAGWFNEGAVNSAGNTGSMFASLDIYIPSYTSSNQKAFSADFVAIEFSSTCYEICTAGWWTGTSAISSIKFITDAGQTWSQYSSATLYGVKKF